MESFVSDIPAGDGETVCLLLQCIRVKIYLHAQHVSKISFREYLTQQNPFLELPNQTGFDDVKLTLIHGYI
jgi:hypothetical protein